MQEIIRSQIDDLINGLKPEIKERAVFVFRERKDESDGRMVLADTAYMTEPPVITFYLETIERMNPTREELREIISHELIHTFSRSEIEAYSKQGKMNFFRDRATIDATMDNIEYQNLADCPDLVDEVVKFWQAEWSSDKSEAGFERQKQSILKKLNIDIVPLIFVAHQNRKFVASAALFLHDLDSRTDLSPWMGGIFTVPEYRGRGIAKMLIAKIEAKAKELGYSKIYLHTEHTAGLYQKLGWQKLCDCQNDQGEPSEIYSKQI